MTGANGNKRNGSTSSRLRSRPPPDPSILRPSISVSVSGLRQVISCLENGTQEVRNFLLDECNVIYECKTCLNMFRSVANFVAHKRSYCEARAQNVKHVYRKDDDDTEESFYSTMAYVEPEAVDTLVPEPHWDIKDYSPSLSLLKEAGFIDEIQSRPVVTKLKPDLNTIINKLKYKVSNPPPVRKIINTTPDIVLKEPVLRLERISQTTCAMFQTISTEEESQSKTMGEKYVEVQKLSQRPIVIVGPDSKIIYPDKSLKSSIAKESVKENYNVRRIYSCVFCDTTMCKVNSIVGHIHKEHGKTLKQAQEYREKIKKTLHLRAHNEAVALPLRKNQLTIKLKNDHSTVGKKPVVAKTPLSYTKRINSVRDRNACSKPSSKLKHKDTLKAKSSSKQKLDYHVDSSDEDVTFCYRGVKSENGKVMIHLKSESLFLQPNIIDKRPSSSGPSSKSKGCNIKKQTPDSSKKHKKKSVGSLRSSTKSVIGPKSEIKPIHPINSNYKFQSKSNCPDGLELNDEYLQIKDCSIVPSKDNSFVNAQTMQRKHCSSNICKKKKFKRSITQLKRTSLRSFDSLVGKRSCSQISRGPAVSNKVPKVLLKRTLKKKKEI